MHQEMASSAMCFLFISRPNTSSSGCRNDKGDRRIVDSTACEGAEVAKMSLHVAEETLLILKAKGTAQEEL